MDYKDYEAGKTSDNFWFKAKKELIRILIRKAVGNKRNLRILNIGAGTGDELEVLKEYGSNYVIDINKKAISLINDDLCVDKKVGDATKLPYKDEFFDVVASFDVFEHISNDEKAVSEAHRVLKKNGVLIFTVPAFQFLFSSHDKALNHYRRYNLKTIKSLLSSFKLKTFFWNSLMFTPVAIIRLLKKKSKPRVDKTTIPAWLNKLLLNLLRIDNFMIKKNLKPLIGLSIAGIGFKNYKSKK